MNYNTIKVAVIDDGINENLYKIGQLDNNIEITSNLNTTYRTGYNLNISSHGTICSAIIKKYAPEAYLSSIKILNTDCNNGNKYQLIKALYWCAENGIKLVNLSLGTINWGDFSAIKKCINDINKSIIVVAACNNKNVYTIPASLTNVIGVKCEKKISDDNYIFNQYPLDGIEITASSRHMLQDTFGNIRYTNICNSFAAPMITALVYKILSKNPSFTIEQIKNELYQSVSNKKDYNPYICNNTDWIKSFSEYNNIELLSEKKILKFDSIVLYESKDKKLSSESLDIIIKKLQHYKKNIIYISDFKISKILYNKLLKEKGVKLWYNKFYELNLAENLSRKLIKINIPIVLICNYWESEIPYNLTKLFLNNLYYSVMISTECRDILKKCEYIPQKVSAKKFLSYIVYKYNCDILFLNINNKISFKKIHKNIEFDIKIELSNDTSSIIVNKGRYSKIFNVKTDNSFQFQVLEIYNLLINILTI